MAEAPGKQEQPESQVKMKKTEEQEKKTQAEIDALTELPKQLKLAGKVYEIEPLSLGKIRCIGNIATRVFSVPRIMEEAQTFEAGDKLQNFLTDHWNTIVDDIILGIRILLEPNKKINLEELKKKQDNLEWELSIVDVMKAIKFISESVNVGELLKNVGSLKGI